MLSWQGPQVSVNVRYTEKDTKTMSRYENLQLRLAAGAPTTEADAPVGGSTTTVAGASTPRAAVAALGASSCLVYSAQDR